MGVHRTPGLNYAGCYVLYPYLEFQAKLLCGEAGVRGADGGEFATGKREPASCRCPQPGTMTVGIEEQPDERPNGRHFPSSEQVELRTPETTDRVLESHCVLTGGEKSRIGQPGVLDLGGWVGASCWSGDEVRT
jgi:hypothetical protein